MHKHRPWLTIEEAAGYLTDKLSEPFTPADIYLLALDSMLTLSLNLLSPVAVFSVELNARRVRMNIISLSSSSDGHPAKYNGILNQPDKLVEYADVKNESLHLIKDVHDVLPKGIIHSALQQLYCQNLGISLPRIEPELYPGCIFDLGEQGLFQLRRLGQLKAEVDSMWKAARNKGVPDDVVRPAIEHYEQQYRAYGQCSDELHFYRMAEHLPVNAFFVVRMAVLDKFIAKEINNLTPSPASSDETGPSSRTFNILVDVLHACLEELYGEKVANNPRKHFDDTNGRIRVMLEQKDCNVPNGRTIERYFNKRFKGL